jgi:hypothetical protein
MLNPPKSVSFVLKLLVRDRLAAGARGRNNGISGARWRPVSL